MRTRTLPSLFVLGVWIAAFAARPARAQNLGTLTGHVYDASGVPLRGITVEASSPTQIGGARTTQTNDEGMFRFTGLYPGTFKVSASAKGLKTVVQENVRVVQNQTTDVDLLLEVETAVEEVKIVEKAPVVNTTKTTVGESFDIDFLNSLPLPSRDYQGAAALAAGVRDLDGDGNPGVRGGSFFNNSYTVDGFETTDPVTNTFGQNFSFNAMQTVEVSTASFGAEGAATTGGIVNIVTKSGSNRFEFDAVLERTGSEMRFFRDARDVGAFGFFQGSVNLGGPIQKDRIWFFVSLEGIYSTYALPKDPSFPEHPAAETYGLNGLGKITWQITPRNKLELTGSISPGAFNNILQSYLVEPEAEARQFQRSEFLGLSWLSTLTDNLVLVTRAAYQQQRLDVGPQSCVDNPTTCTEIPAEIDVATGIQRQNYSSQSIDQRQRFQASGQLEWFKDTKRFGSHAVKVGTRFMAMTNPVRRTVPGDAVLFRLGNEPFIRREVCSNDPKLSNGECRTNFLYTEVSGLSSALFVHDAWRPTRHLIITPGVALNLSRSTDDKGSGAINMNAVTPHLSAVWDATRDGKTALRASVNSNVDTGFLALAAFAARDLYQRQCSWDPEAKAYTRNCRSFGGSSGTTLGLPCGPEGVGPDGQPCKGKLRAPRTWEYTVGGEREVWTGVAVGGDFIYRKFNHQWEDVETNANWNSAGTGLRREAPFKSGRSEFVYDLQTPDQAQRTYKAFTAYLRKREGVLRALVSYTWARYEGVMDNNYASLFLDNPSQAVYFHGPLSDDIRHDLRLQGTYQAAPWLSLGAAYTFWSGRPYNRYFFDPVFGGFTRFQAPRGYDSRGTLDPDDDVPLRLPDISQLDLKIMVSLMPLIKRRVDLWADVFNVLALRTTTSVFQQDGPFWGRSANRLPPMRARLGARYRF